MSDELKTPLRLNGHMIDPLSELKYSGIIDRDENPVFRVAGYERQIKAIVHRVNCHDKLVEALRELVTVCDLLGIECSSEVRDAKAALELAKGGGHD